MKKALVLIILLSCFIHFTPARELTGGDTISVSLRTGWNIFSANVLPDSTDIKYIFNPLILNGSLVKIQDETGNALENLGVLGGWWNFIGLVALTEGYKVKVNTNSLITITGQPATFPFAIPLKAGWNIMGYPAQAEIDGLNVVRQLIDRKTLVKVQDELGNAIEDLGVLGGWQNNIGTFSPGEGYKIKVSANENLILYDLPRITTNAVTNITNTTATGGGHVTGDGGSAVIARGLCWNTTGNPVITGSKTVDGSGTGTFTSNLTGLTPGITYYVRAYATSSTGTAYGAQVTFTPPVSVSLPVVATGTVSMISQTTTHVGGQVISDGNTAVTVRGICWNTSGIPNVTDSKTTDGSGLGNFTGSLSGLTTNTVYYARAYATNAAGTAYGETVQFTTLLTVNTGPVAEVTQAAATTGGSVLAGGGAPVLNRGICWSTTPGPTTSGNKLNLGTGSGTFSGNMTGLVSNTRYYVRAFATNSSGTVYGEEVQFFTLPAVTTTTVTAITATSASSGGAIAAGGGAVVNARGVCWNTTGTPVINDNKTNDGSGTGSFTSEMTGLNANTTVYVRAYATNSQGTAYGNQLVFTTPHVLTPPVVVTAAPVNITTQSAVLGGSVTGDGHATVTEKGIVYALTQYPATDDNKVAMGSGTGSFSGTVSGLTPGKSYYVRAYAINSQGTAYGEQFLFATLAEGSTTIADADGNIYRIVTIGTQDWMGENLRTTRYSDGTAIPNVTAASSWTALTTGAYCWYNNDESAYKNIYGALYNWYAADDSRKLCPAGWHVPTDAEWTLLENYLIANGYNFDGTTTGNKIGKALADTVYWQSSPYAGSVGRIDYPAYRNKSKFSALPGGGRAGNGAFDILGSWGIWWSSTTYSTSEAWARYLGNTETSLDRFSDHRNLGYSVRCIRDNATLPTVTTAEAGAITQTGATGGGNVTADGAAAVTARGLCWNTGGSPVTSDHTTVSGNGTGSFTATMTGLTAGTVYYVRAWATNSQGTAYGNQVAFTTKPEITWPVVSTHSISDITQTTAAGGGTIVSGGNDEITARGICWNTSGNPDLTNSKTNDGTGTGAFNSLMTGLTPGAKYYVRAYAVNTLGAAFGEEVSFTSLLPATLPVVTTAGVTGITQDSATGGGNVTSDGNTPVTARGICWNTTGNPTTGNSKTTDGAGTGSFTSLLTGLTDGTTYYVRAYATNSQGTAYGAQVTFATPVISLPAVSTGNVADISFTTATCGGEVTGDGGAPVTLRGICWNTSGNPSTFDNRTENGSGTGSFTANLTGLAPGTLYYARAYATNSKGTGYGNTVTFTTRPEIILPTVNTIAVTAITRTTATSGGNVTHDGNDAVTARGVCWNTTGAPTVADNTTSDGTGTGSFTSSLTGLTPGTPYYVRAWATNSKGTAYGNQVTFTSSPEITLPALTTAAVSAITLTTASGGGTVTEDGGDPVTARGVCWNTTGNPAFNDSKTSNGTGTGSFSASITGLAANTVYYTRAYAVNTKGTAYGNQVTFTTLAEVNTGTVSSITTSSASVTGNVPAGGGATITAKGICWNTTGNPTTSNPKTGNGSGAGSFTGNLTGLTSNTVYYARAYATNATGTTYGEEVQFTTLTAVTTGSVSAITRTTASVGGSVAAGGGAPVSARGICWNTTGNPTTADNITSNGTGTGSFTGNLTGLTANTVYYTRAYAVNSSGTAYGSVVPFTTNPEVATGTLSNLTQTTVTVEGSVLAGGGASITARGICWNTSGNPTTANSKTGNGTGAGTFTGNLTGLTSNTVYYARAYASNNSGTAYGEQVQITTLPSVTTAQVSQVKPFTATCGGNVANGGGAPILVRGVCWNTSGNPSLSDAFTSDDTGTGSFTSNLTGLMPGTTYYVKAFATNSGGVSYGSEVTLTTTPVVYDADGNLYFTTQIGTQTWLTENLKTTTYNDGTDIPNVTDNTTWSGLTDGAYCFYNNDENNKSTYGGLYNWYAVNSGKLCPAGWHVPSEAEWTLLVNSLGGELEAGGRLKEAGTTHWLSPNTGATNESGFTALPGGIRGGYGAFYNIGQLGYWWSTTEFSSTFAVDLGLYYNETEAGISTYPKEFGFSVRCMKD